MTDATNPNEVTGPAATAETTAAVQPAARDGNGNRNVDTREIAKFDRMASRWWDPESDFKPLHQMNPIRANYIDAHSPVAGQMLLDIGCGGGLLTEAMAQRGAVATGIDMGAGPLEVARLHSLESGLAIDYVQTTAEAFAEQRAGEFDVVTCLEMLEHVPDPAAVVQACVALAKPGGNIYFSTINRTFKAYGLAVIGAEYVLRLLPRGTHAYAKFIRPSELARWARNSGLEIKDVCGITYNPLTQHFKLNPRDVDVNYLMHLQKPF